MAHPQQVVFCNSVKNRLPAFFHNKFVVDIGSLDINGNNQYLFEDCLYLGVDLSAGRNVDLICAGHKLSLPDSSIDVVVSSECFEHDTHYALTLKNIVRLLKPGGLFLFTCATTGRPEHGTRRTTPEDAPFIQGLGEWGDYYKNLTEADIREVIALDEIFSEYAFDIGHETHDLYFWGVKKGLLDGRNNYSFQIQASGLRVELKSKNEQIIRLENCAESYHRTIADRDAQINARDVQINARDVQINARDVQINATHQEVNDLLKRLDALQAFSNQSSARLEEAQMQISKMSRSNSWKLTKPLRFIGRLARGEFKIAFATLDKQFFSRVYKGLMYLAKGDLIGLKKRIAALRREEKLALLQKTSATEKITSWTILTTPHTLFLAQLIENQLRKHNWSVDILTKAPEFFDADCYIVLCPQMFKKLPTGEKRIVFQLEQSVSSRWFNPKYFETLNTSLAVLEYSQQNMDFLNSKGISYPQVHYLPIGAISIEQNKPEACAKKYDVLFYGDCNSSDRRMLMLTELKKHFNVHIESELFGHEMHEVIKQSSLVINLHYYENALLETPRIQECLSLGTPVVSEDTLDRIEYPELSGAVIFFEQSSISAMIEAVRSTLNQKVMAKTVAESVELSKHRFEFMFDRFLIAMGFLTSNHTKHIKIPDFEESNMVALSLPETVERRKKFLNMRPDNCVIFDGIRRNPGWIGCGLSYLALANYSLGKHFKSLTVMEDDVILPNDFHGKLLLIRRYLDSHSATWDVFSGVIASLHEDTVVSHVEIFEEITFVTINKMTSTVFNIYSNAFLSTLSKWDPENLDSATNTIDKYIEGQMSLRVVVALPFFVGHREEVHSTLWGFQNTQYSQMIKNSQTLLIKKVADFTKNLT